MWGNDFPHPEGTWPHTKEWLRNAFHDIPVDETADMLGGNTAACYGFDTAALRPLADRIGPSPEDLGQTGDDLDKWADLAAAGRPWLTGKEALELPVGRLAGRTGTGPPAPRRRPLSAAAGPWRCG